MNIILLLFNNSVSSLVRQPFASLPWLKDYSSYHLIFLQRNPPVYLKIVWYFQYYPFHKLLEIQIMWMLRSKIITINNDYIALKLFKFDIINSYLYTSHCPRSKITIGFWHIYYPFISIRILRSTAQANSFSLKSCKFT